MKVKIISVLFIVIGAAGIANAQKNDISEAEYLQVEARAAELLNASGYRLRRVGEYFEDRSKSSRIAESDILEVLQPNKRRTVEIRDYNGKIRKEERIWDGKSLYVRTDDGEWKQFSGGSGGGGRIESGQTTKKYRFLGKVDLDGVQADLYELESLRIANKFSANDMIVVRFNKKIRSWYSPDGKLLQKIIEDSIEGRQDLSRETTKIEYEPNIKIEAPIP
ncbi:hypothetical protein BH24ACI3_BH24ACI3_03040 [soil metagenome]